MSKLFEAFKEYHNANYHDGDSSFDERTYLKSNGYSFDDEFVQDCFEHFEAAWEYQQKIIDDLEMHLWSEE